MKRENKRSCAQVYSRIINKIRISKHSKTKLSNFKVQQIPANFNEYNENYGGPQVSCHHFSFEFDKTFFMQQNLIFGTQIIIFWP